MYLYKTVAFIIQMTNSSQTYSSSYTSYTSLTHTQVKLIQNLFKSLDTHR